MVVGMLREMNVIDMLRDGTAGLDVDAKNIGGLKHFTMNPVGSIKERNQNETKTN